MNNMGKVKEIIINSFDGGLTNDWRSKSFNKYALASHFDTSFAHKLAPRVGVTANETAAANIVKFLHASREGTQVLFGFGVSTNVIAVYYWNNTAWAEYANNTSASGTRNETVFFHYKNYIYMWKAGTTLVRFDAYDSSDAFDDAYQSINYSSVVQPVLHPLDNIAYFFSNYTDGPHVHKLNDTTWAADTFTGLPTDMKIVAACSYGPYLAIACSMIGGTMATGDHSYVYLWDRDSTLNTVSHVIDFGVGEIKHIATLDNKLIVVMLSEDDKLVTVKQYMGQFGIEIGRLVIDSDVVFGANSQVIDNKLYFPMTAPLLGDNRRGIWRVDSYGRLALDFTISTATTYNGIYFTGDRWWVAHDSGEVDMSTSAAEEDAVYESLIISEPGKKYKLLSVGAMYQAGSPGDEVTLKYRTEAGGTWTTGDWTTIFARTSIVATENYHEAVNIEASGANLPQFREIQFQVTTDKVFLGLKIRVEEIDANPG